MSSEVRRNRNVCSRCKVLFETAVELVAHLQTCLRHHLCPLCNNEKDFATFEEYKDHVFTVHLGCMACGWPAPSEAGLKKHTMYVHHMCPDCKINFVTNHEYCGHCQLKRPRSVECVGCDQKFHTLSAAFNHLESSNCESGIKKEDIEKFRDEFLSERGEEGLYCPSCERVFGRMCDLMQHAETPACKDGYWKGSGSVGQLVEHILSRIKMIIPPKDVILHYE